MDRMKISDDVKHQIKNFRLPDYKEIPDIGLFLEQTTKFVTEFVEPLEGISLTASMISNYVKKKIIANPIKKQYYRDQIAEIIFIAIVKSVLSLEEAQKMLVLQREKYESKDAYAYFCCEFRQVLGYVFGLETELRPMEEEDSVEKELLRKVITAVAYKIYLNETFKIL